MTSCTQKELQNYPGFGVSEQKPPCLLVHAHTLSKQCYLQYRLIPRSISGIIRIQDAWEHNYNIRNIPAAGQNYNEHKPLQPKKENIPVVVLCPFSFWPLTTQHHLSHLDSPKLPHVTNPTYVVFGYCTISGSISQLSHSAPPAYCSPCRGTAGPTNNRHKPGIMEKMKSFAFLCQTEPKRHFHTFFMLACISEICPWCPAISQFTVYSLHSLAVQISFSGPCGFRVSPGNSASLV